MVVLPAPLPETTRTSYESVAGATSAYDVRLLPRLDSNQQPGREAILPTVGWRALSYVENPQRRGVLWTTMCSIQTDPSPAVQADQ